MKTPLHPLTSLLLVCLAATSCSTDISELSPSVPSVSPMDPDATPETRSLLLRLRAQEGKRILFGHQHSLSVDFAFDTGDGNTFDTLAAVGDHPTVFGWNSLVLDEDEAPGDPDATPEANAEVLTRMFKQADTLGGINTLTMRLPNLVTDRDFYDTSEGTVAVALPGDVRHPDLTARLDRVADAVAGTRYPDDTLIPVILRPWHERNGDWFWWGVRHATDQQYVELFRFTIDYLRDERGLRNLLCAYSPNSPLNAGPGAYLVGYPEDDHVDILGHDSYDETGGGQEWLRPVITDLAMVAGLAGERRKVPAWTEFRPYEDTEPDPHWFTSVLGALKTDQNASHIAWMLTWTNCSHGDREHAYIPYPAHDDHPEHPLLADFRVFHDDPSTVFAKGWKRWSLRTTARRYATVYPRESLQQFRSHDGIVGSCRDTVSEGAEVNAKSPTVVFAGNSITGTGKDRVSSSSGIDYVTRLAKEPLAFVRVVNAGANGNYIASLETCFEGDVLVENPDLIGIFISIDDTWRAVTEEAASPLGDFGAAYQRLIENLDKAPSVLVVPFVAPVTPDQEGWFSDLRPRQDLVHRLVAECGCTVVDLGLMVREYSSKYENEETAGDGVHPTDLGHKLIAEA